MSKSYNIFDSNDSSVNINKFAGFESSMDLTKKSFDTEQFAIGAVLDLETTGLDVRVHQVIQIGIRLFSYDRQNFKNIKIGNQLSFYQQPSQPLPKKIELITGITQEKIKGKKIPWQEVCDFLSICEIVITHNALFDRSFLEKESTTKITDLNWACSINQIDWYNKGYKSINLESLCLSSGFFGEFHDAANDADLLLNLIAIPRPTKAILFEELLLNSHKPLVRIEVANFPFHNKNVLKDSGYRWAPEEKIWFKVIYTNDLIKEKQYMDKLRNNSDFSYVVVNIQTNEKFSNSKNSYINSY